MRSPEKFLPQGVWVHDEPKLLADKKSSSCSMGRFFIVWWRGQKSSPSTSGTNSSRDVAWHENDVKMV
jgi:hypothetical protein